MVIGCGHPPRIADRTPGVFQIESVYTQPQYRGNGLSGALIREHLSQFAKTGTRSAEIQLMKDNVPAIIAYQKVGFTFKSEKSSENRKLGRLFPVRAGETSMKKEEMIGKLKSVFQNVLEENDITITREMTAQDIEKWDSLRHIQLISEVERVFGIKFKLREVLSMKNVGDLIDLIHAKQGIPA